MEHAFVQFELKKYVLIAESNLRIFSTFSKAVLTTIPQTNLRK